MDLISLHRKNQNKPIIDYLTILLGKNIANYTDDLSSFIFAPTGVHYCLLQRCKKETT